MRNRIVCTAVGSGDNGKTSSLIAIGYTLAAKGFPVTLIGFDPEPENNLTRLLESKAEDVSRAKLTITDLLRMPWAKAGKPADDLLSAIEEATMRFNNMGVIRCDQELVNYEVEGGDILGLAKVINLMRPGFILVDCAAGTGGFSMLSAVAAADHVIGVSKPSSKSIAIARRACGLDPMDLGDGEMGSFLDQVTLTDTENGIVCAPKYLGTLGTMFIGAHENGDGVEIAQSGISLSMRDYMTQITNIQGFLGFIPYRTGKDQRDVVKAYAVITERILERLGVTQ
jgi:cellulose biosynthesis protein BcsQ